MSEQISWEQLRTMDLAGKTIVYCTGNDGPDEGYCLHGVVTRTEVTEVSGERLFKIHFFQPMVREETGAQWKKIPDDKDFYIGWVMIDPLAPLLGDGRILHFVCLPHHEAHIHLDKEPVRQ